MSFTTVDNDDRNSFSWDKLRMKLAPGNHLKAHRYHWVQPDTEGREHREDHSCHLFRHAMATLLPMLSVVTLLSSVMTPSTSELNFTSGNRPGDFSLEGSRRRPRTHRAFVSPTYEVTSNTPDHRTGWCARSSGRTSRCSEVETEPFELDDDQLAELEEGIAEADRGEIAPANEVLAPSSRPLTSTSR